MKIKVTMTSIRISGLISCTIRRWKETMKLRLRMDMLYHTIMMSLITIYGIILSAIREKNMIRTAICTMVMDRFITDTMNT